MTPEDVERDDAGGRFVASEDGHTAELTFRRTGDRLALDHTGVPESMSGGGVGSALVQAAVRFAADEGLTIVPHCTFARGWMERHPDDLQGVTVDWGRSG